MVSDVSEVESHLTAVTYFEYASVQEPRGTFCPNGECFRERERERDRERKVGLLKESQSFLLVV